MTNGEAIFVLKTMDETYTGAVNREALKMAISALEKQEPMKVQDKGLISPCSSQGGIPYIRGSCPVCGQTVVDYAKYCRTCGKRIAWKEAE